MTKINFSKLFAEAWLQAVIPANIMAGLKACGVYPFGHNTAIPWNISIEQESQFKSVLMKDTIYT